MNRLISSLIVAAAAATLASPSRAQGATLSNGRATYQAQCAICHGVDRTGGMGPSLVDLDTRAVASAPFGYSAALKAQKGRWDHGRLDAFLEDPQAAVPGTTMAANVANDAQRRELVDFLLAPSGPAAATAAADAPSSASRFGDWRTDAPGHSTHITVADLPQPYATPSASNSSRVVPRPAGAMPKVPAGFSVAVFASDLSAPRQLRVAPNGDVFVTETSSGRLRVLRPSADGSRSEQSAVFASGLAEPFGLAFYPPGPDPQWLYVGETNRVVRYRYTRGSIKADGAPEVVLKQIAPSTGGHSMRDLALSNDGQWFYIGVGSASNVAEGMSKSTADLARADPSRALGAAWGSEEGRALVLAFKPDGSAAHAYATGIRNCSGIAVQPTTNIVWCSTNERDSLGDDLVPDYVTRVKPGGFYGWPWWYLGDHEDPRHAGERPDLRGRMSLPDVLLQPHAASLGMTFAPVAHLPAAWKGSAFAAEHGSWNRASRTGSKLIRILVDPDGTPTGSYEDVMTGFVLDDRQVWGRVVGVTDAPDGSLLVSDDAGGVIWRLVYSGR